MLWLENLRSIEAALDYETDVELFASGQEACDHGLAEIAAPGPEAVEVMAKVTRLQQRRLG